MTRYDRALEALAVQYPGLERERPAILDLAARVLSRCHDAIDGRVCDLTAVMSAKHARELLRGERPVAPLLFLAEMALDEPEALVAGLRELLEVAGFEAPRPQGQVVPERHMALARAMKESSEAFAEAIAAEADDTITTQERSAILREMDEGIESMVEARAAYARPSRPRPRGGRDRG